MAAGQQQCRRIPAIELPPPGPPIRIAAISGGRAAARMVSIVNAKD